MEALIQDCRISYRFDKNEDSEGPVVLMMHGWGCDGSVFSSFLPEFSKHASVLTVDFPGHGQSGEPLSAWGVPEYAEQIMKLLDMLSVSKVHIVAHSFGGRVAIWLASHYPEMIDKMVITGGAGIRKPAAQTQSKKQMQYKKLKNFVRMLERIAFLKGVAANLQEKLIQKYGSADYKRLNANMRQTFVKVINHDLSDLLPQIKASTLLIWGSNDTETPLWMGQKMEKEIADAGLIVFDGRSHFAFLEEVQRFRVIVSTFFWGGNAE